MSSFLYSLSPRFPWGYRGHGTIKGHTGRTRNQWNVRSLIFSLIIKSLKKVKCTIKMSVSCAGCNKLHFSLISSARFFFLLSSLISLPVYSFSSTFYNSLFLFSSLNHFSSFSFSFFLSFFFLAHTFFFFI